MARWLAHCTQLGSILALLACGGPGTKPAPSDARADTSVDSGASEVAPGCDPALRTAAAVCCPAGHAPDPDGLQCLAVGPPECATSALVAPEQCRPRWCSAWRDGDGKPCAAMDHPLLANGLCLPVARTCTTAELQAQQGCAVGEAPNAAGGCHPAGQFALPGQHSAQPESGGLPVALPALATPSLPRWCLGADGGPTACGAGKSGCAVGEYPDKTGDCQPIAGPGWLCPPGFVVAATAPAADLPQCLPDPADCGNPPYGGAAAQATHYVDPAATATGTGTAASPWQSLAVALAQAPTAATLALAAGDHLGPFVVAKPLKIRGRCAALVHLHGAKAEAPTMTLAGNASLDLRGVTVQGGVQSSDGSALAMKRTAVRVRGGPGIAVAGAGATLQLSDALVTGAGYTALPDQTPACVSAAAGASVSVSRARLSFCWQAGLLVTDAATAATLTEAIVDDARATPPDLANGRGILVAGGAKLTASQLWIHHCRVSGVAVWDDSHVNLQRIAVTATQVRQSDQAGGYGVRLDDDAFASVHHARLADNHTAGLAAGTNARVVGGNLLVSGTLTAKLTSVVNAALRWLDAASGQLAFVAAVGNYGNAVMLFGPAEVSLTHVLCADTRDIGAQPGSAISLYEGATLTLADARVHRTQGKMLEAWDAGTLLLAADVVLDEPPGDAPNEMGILVSTNALVRLDRVRIAGARNVGFSVQKGGQAQVRGLVVDGGRAGDNAAGRGIEVQTAGRLLGHGVRLSGNTEIGAGAFGGSSVALADVVVDAMQSGTDAEGVTAAFYAAEAGQIVGHGVRWLGVQRFGAVVTGTQTRGELHGLAYDQALGGGAHFSAGVLASDGAALQLIGAALHGTSGFSVAVLGGSQAQLARVVATGSASLAAEPGAKTYFPNHDDAIVLSDAVATELRDSVLAGKRRSGLLVANGQGISVWGTALHHNLLGAVLQGAAATTLVQMAIFANQQANQAGDLGLSVPKPPKLVLPQ